MTKSKETNVIDANELLEKVRTKAHKILEKHNTKICTFSFADRGWQSRNWSSSEGIPDLYMVKFQLGLFEPFERDFWYEKRGDIEIATTFVKSTKPWFDEPVANRMVLKLKNIMFYCDFEARTAFFIKDGIKVSWREGEPIKYKDKSGVEYTLADYIFPHGIFGYRRENIIYDLDGFSIGNSWETKLHTDMWKFLENFDFLSVNEKYPDGTYREFDKDGRIIKDVSPDGTETIYAYPQELSLAMNKEEKIFKLVSDVEFVLKRISKTRISLVLKKVVKANETLYYLNNSYAGKVVTQKGTEERGLGEIVSGTYTYDSRDKLVESIETEYHFYPKSSQKVYKTYKSEYFDNGNKKSKECISGVHSGDTIYYDPENNGKEIAHTTHNNSLLFAFNDPKARKAMKKSFEIAMKQGNMKEAKMALEAILNSFAGLKPDYFHTGISLMVRGEPIALDIKVLDDNKIAIGSVYENRYWVGTTPLLRGNGIEWNWKTAAAIIDLQDEHCGLVAFCETSSINVRHAHDPNKDLWNKIDKNNFMVIDPKTGILTVGLRMDNEHGHEWVESATINTKEKIAEYDEFVTEKREDLDKNIVNTIKAFKKASETTVKMVIEDDTLKNDKKTIDYGSR